MTRKIRPLQIKDDQDGWLFNSTTTGEVILKQSYDSTEIDSKLALKGDITYIDAADQTLQTNIINNTNNITTNATAITNLQSDNNIQDDKIVTNSANINANYIDILGLRTDIDLITPDSHTHTNKNELDLISSVGSGSIITTAERTKLTNIEVGAQVNTVDSVNNQTGIINLQSADITETTNLYWTDTRFQSAFALKNTDDLSEGNNKYYSNTLFDIDFNTKSTTDLTEGTNLYYTDLRVDTRNNATLSAVAFSNDYTDLDNIPATIDPSPHTHIETDITDLNKYTTAEVDSLLVPLATTSYVDTQDTTLQTNINTNITNIDNNTSNITTNSNSISTNITNISSLDSLKADIVYVDAQDLILQDQIDSMTTNFISLTDTPAVYTAEAGKQLVVNATEDGIEFVTSTTAWADITGKPASYPPSGHTHPISQVDFLQGELDKKALKDSETFTGFVIFDTNTVSFKNKIYFPQSTGNNGTIQYTTSFDSFDISTANTLNLSGNLIELKTSELRLGNKTINTNEIFINGSAWPVSTYGVSGQVLSTNGSGTLSWIDQTSGSGGNVDSVFGRTGIVTAQTGDYSTTEVDEGTNLYYTDTRVSNNTDVISNTAKISADGSINTHLDVDISTVNEADILIWRTDKFVTEQATPGGGNVDSVFGRTGIVTAQTDDYNTSQVTENINLYYTNDRVSNNTDVTGNTAARHTHSNINELDLITDAASGVVISSAERSKLENIEIGAQVNPATTDDLVEGVSNLYFSNKDTDDLIEGSNKYYATSLFDIDFASKTTADLVESNNLYYTQARFDAAFIAKDTDDLSEGTINSYYSESLFDTSFATKSTADLVENNNLYYTDGRVDTRISLANIQDLNDVVITSVSSPDYLKYNGVNWVNQQILYGEIADAPSKYVDIIPMSGVYTFDVGDHQAIYEANGTFTMTLPLGLPKGWEVVVNNVGNGIITFAVEAGGNIQGKGVLLTNLWDTCVIYNSGSNNYRVVGDVV